MLGWFYRGLLVVFSFAFEIGALEAQSLEEVWGLSPVQKQLRHRLEKATKQGNTLHLNVWYEDYAIRHGQEPDSEIYCRLGHTLLFGKNRLRENALLPADASFSRDSSIQNIQLTFYSVFYRNLPLPPGEEINQGREPKNKLRVVWKRQEKVIPYLEVNMSKREWMNLKKVLKGRGNLNYRDFRSNLCAGILPVLPPIKSNFLSIQNFFKDKKNNETQGAP